MDPTNERNAMPPPPEAEPAAPAAPPARPPTTRELVLAAIAGLVAAIVGGIVWGLIVDATDAELGIAAIGIGVLTGFAVVLVSRGARGVPLQVIAAVTAILGVLWGKYYAFVQIGQGFIEEEFGSESGLSLPLFSGDTFSLFMDGVGDLFSGWDLAWIAFAVYTAWRIPQGQGFGRWAPGRRPA